MPIRSSHKGGGYAQRHDSAAVYNFDRYQYAASRDMNGHYYKHFTFHSGLPSILAQYITAQVNARPATKVQIPRGDGWEKAHRAS
jgi:hypothetical protein